MRSRSVSVRRKRRIRVAGKLTAGDSRGGGLRLTSQLVGTDVAARPLRPLDAALIALLAGTRARAGRSCPSPCSGPCSTCEARGTGAKPPLAASGANPGPPDIRTVSLGSSANGQPLPEPNRLCPWESSEPSSVQYSSASPPRSLFPARIGVRERDIAAREEDAAAVAASVVVAVGDVVEEGDVVEHGVRLDVEAASVARRLVAAEGDVGQPVDPVRGDHRAAAHVSGLVVGEGDAIQDRLGAVAVEGAVSLTAELRSKTTSVSLMLASGPEL